MVDRRPNRLIHEPSPYLQQHAHNPVDWYPWGPEAIEAARSSGKPILLSIGYSACHWCHVMERESFENDEIARKMNELFVCIKVDREERPDLDQVYQLTVQLMGRSGGWPLTVFLTPDQRPFFAGTYFPPTDRYGIPGFGEVLERLAQAYRAEREDIEEQARELCDAMRSVYRSEGDEDAGYTLSTNFLQKAVEGLSARFDDIHGGFGPSPKFPNAMLVDLLLRRGLEERDAKASTRARLTLEAMRKGGIWDHLAGGFHRYATDSHWLVPHFEKMLYDNGLLLRLYCDGMRAFGEEAYASVASDIGTYLLREMQSDRGGFYTSQDADSPGGEGAFFVWTDAEVRALFDGNALAYDVVRKYFGIEPSGNFESTGATVLSEQMSVTAIAEVLGRPVGDILRALDEATGRMLAVREKRPRPSRDEKILASWNGLTIAALADASAALGEPALLAAAEQAYAHITRTLVAGGEVQRLTKDGMVRGPGFLDDYAFMSLAALELYEVTGDRSKLSTAAAIADEIIGNFWSPVDRVFYLAPNDARELIVRVEDRFDHAMPSGSAIASLVLLKLGVLEDEHYSRIATQYLEKVAPHAVANPFAYGQTLAVLDRLVRGSTDIVIWGPHGHPTTRALYDAVFSAYVPNRNVMLVDPERPSAIRPAERRLLQGQRWDGNPAAFICRERTCSVPLHTADEVKDVLSPV